MKLTTLFEKTKLWKYCLRLSGETQAFKYSIMVFKVFHKSAKLYYLHGISLAFKAVSHLVFLNRIMCLIEKNNFNYTILLLVYTFSLFVLYKDLVLNACIYI